METSLAISTTVEHSSVKSSVTLVVQGIETTSRQSGNAEVCVK